MKNKTIQIFIALLLVFTAVGLPACSEDEAGNSEPQPSLKVSEVVVLNSTEIKISFNQNIEKSTAESTANYTLLEGKEAITVNTAKATEKEVVITLKKNLQTANYLLTMTNLKAKETNKIIEKYEYRFGYEVPATIERVEVIERDLLKLHFTKNIDPESCKKSENYNITGNFYPPALPISGSWNLQFIKAKGSTVFIRLNDWTCPLKGGAYKIQTQNIKYADGTPFTGSFPEFNYTSPKRWKKQVDFPVKKTQNPSDPLTWTFFNCRQNKAITFSNLDEMVNSNMWDIAFIFDGYEMLIKSNTKQVGIFNQSITELHHLRTEGADVTISSAQQPIITKHMTRNGMYPNYNFDPSKLVSADVRTAKDSKELYHAYWCVKDAPNYYELNKKKDKKTPFKIIPNRTIGFYLHYPIGEGNGSRVPGCKMQITSIYKGAPPQPVPDDYTYHLSFIYLVGDMSGDLDYPIDLE